MSDVFEEIIANVEEIIPVGINHEVYSDNTEGFNLTQVIYVDGIDLEFFAGSASPAIGPYFFCSYPSENLPEGFQMN